MFSHSLNQQRKYTDRPARSASGPSGTDRLVNQWVLSKARREQWYRIAYTVWMEMDSIQAVAEVDLSARLENVAHLFVDGQHFCVPFVIPMNTLAKSLSDLSFSIR